MTKRKKRIGFAVGVAAASPNKKDKNNDFTLDDDPQQQQQQQQQLQRAPPQRSQQPRYPMGTKVRGHFVRHGWITGKIIAQNEDDESFYIRYKVRPPPRRNTSTNNDNNPLYIDERQVSEEELEGLVADYKQYKRDRKKSIQRRNSNADSTNDSSSSGNADEALPEWWPQEETLGADEKAFLKALDLPDVVLSASDGMMMVVAAAPPPSITTLDDGVVPDTVESNEEVQDSAETMQGEDEDAVADGEEEDTTTPGAATAKLANNHNQSPTYDMTLSELATVLLPREEVEDKQALDELKAGSQKLLAKRNDLVRIKHKAEALRQRLQQWKSGLGTLKRDYSEIRSDLPKKFPEIQHRLGVGPNKRMKVS